MACMSFIGYLKLDIYSMGQLLTVKQAAYILKVHPLTIRRYIREKKLLAVKAGGNIRIKEEDLNNLNMMVTPSEVKRERVVQQAIKRFTLDDPIWRLNGRAASLSLPEFE